MGSVWIRLAYYICRSDQHYFLPVIKKQSVTKSYLTLKQSFGIFLSVSLFVLCVEFFKLLTLTDFTDRIVLFILMLLLILFDILTYFQVKKYFKR